MKKRKKLSGRDIKTFNRLGKIVSGLAFGGSMIITFIAMDWLRKNHLLDGTSFSSGAGLYFASFVVCAGSFLVLIIIGSILNLFVINLLGLGQRRV